MRQGLILLIVGWMMASVGLSLTHPDSKLLQWNHAIAEQFEAVLETLPSPPHQQQERELLERQQHFDPNWGRR